MSTDPQPLELQVDPERTGKKSRGETGFFFRATLNGKWGSHDLLELKRESVIALLEERGPCSPWVKSLVLGLLCHPHVESMPTDPPAP